MIFRFLLTKTFIVYLTYNYNMDVSIRQLLESDLATADDIFRLAFGTFAGLPNPRLYAGDVTYMNHWYAAPTGAFGAEVDGVLVGVNFATHWGSVGFFGPLCVKPEFWGQGIAKRLIEPVMEYFAQHGTKQLGLITFSNSPKHLGLYQKFGFWPRFLTVLMNKPVQAKEQILQAIRYSQVAEEKRAECLKSCFELTDGIYEGLDLESEIRVVDARGLGDTLLLWHDTGLIGLAICHYGKDTEAGSDTCYIKFGAVRPGIQAGQFFQQLLDECETLARIQGVSRLAAGVNTGRHAAYQQMLARGFQTTRVVVAMHKPNEAAYHQPEYYVIDDWR